MEVRPATLDEVRTAQAKGETLKLVRLALDMQSAITEKEMHTNFFSTLERGFKSVIPYLGKHTGSCSLVGSGPSIKETYKEIVGDIVSINSSIWFLLEKEIVPKYHMIWDAFEVCEKFAVPHPDITYLIASRCHPKVFENLKDCKVVVWHAGGDHDIIDVMSRADVQEKMGGVQPLINGGSAGITRGMFVAHSLGYTDMHIFGGDSSYSMDGATHVMGSVVREKDVMIALGDGSAGAPPMWFRTTPEWCQQVNEYRLMYALYVPNKIANLTVHGGGLLGEMHKRLVGKLELQGPEKFLAEVAGQEVTQREADALASGKSAELPTNEITFKGIN